MVIDDRTIGERIRYFRTLRGMTQKTLGMAVGFSERTADVRIAQYESGKRTPKQEMLNALAHVLHVMPEALAVPCIFTKPGLRQTLVALEDIYGYIPKKINGRCYLFIEDRVGADKSVRMPDYFVRDWCEKKAQLDAGEISQDEYDFWRYNYPASDPHATARSDHPILTFDSYPRRKKEDEK